jgi:hypothetical protein
MLDGRSRSSLETAKKLAAVLVRQLHGVDLFGDTKASIFERNILVAFLQTIEDLLQPVGLRYRE